MTTRAEAVRTLEEGQRAVDALVARLTEDELARPAVIGGGDWSAKDLIGHLTSWEEIALDALAEWRRGERPSIEDVFRSDGTDRLNDETIARKAPLPLAGVRAAAEATHLTLVGEIEAMDDSEWKAKASYPTERRTKLSALLGSVLGAPQRPFGHAFAHLPDLEAYVASVRANA